MKAYTLKFKKADFASTSLVDNEGRRVWQTQVTNLYDNNQYRNYTLRRANYGTNLLGNGVYTGVNAVGTTASEIGYKDQSATPNRFIDTSGQIDIIGWTVEANNISSNTSIQEPQIYLDVYNGPTEAAPDGATPSNYWAIQRNIRLTGTIYMIAAYRYSYFEFHFNMEGMTLAEYDTYLNNFDLTFLIRIEIDAPTIDVFFPKTGALLNKFPQWMDINETDPTDPGYFKMSTPTSIGGKLLNAVAGEWLTDIYSQINYQTTQYYLDTVDLSQKAWVYRTSAVGGLIHSITGDGINLASTANIGEFHVSVPADQAYYWNINTDEIYCNILYRELLLNGKAVPQELYNIWNNIDDLGLAVDLRRHRRESNESFRDRIRDVYINKPGVALEAFKKAVRRELNLWQFYTPSGVYLNNPTHTEGYVSLPGTVGNYLTTLDAPSLDITGDITIVAKIAPNDWTPAATSTLVAKNGNADPNRCYWLNLLAAGTLQFIWSPNGTSASQQTAASTVAVGAVDGSWKWVAVTLDVDNGLTREVKFWTSDTGVTWSLLGAPVTGVITSIFAGASPLSIGGLPATGTAPLAGKVSYVSVRNGIGVGGGVGGTEVFTFDSGDLVNVAPDAVAFTATSGQTVSVNRSAGAPKTTIIPSLTGSTPNSFFVGATPNTLEMQDIENDSKYFDERGNPKEKFKHLIEELATNYPITWGYFRYGQAFWDQDGLGHDGFSYLPRIYDATPLTANLIDSGVGDGNDLFLMRPDVKSRQVNFDAKLKIRGRSRANRVEYQPVKFDVALYGQADMVVYNNPPFVGWFTIEVLNGGVTYFSTVEVTSVSDVSLTRPTPSSMSTAVVEWYNAPGVVPSSFTSSNFLFYNKTTGALFNNGGATPSNLMMLKDIVSVTLKPGKWNPYLATYEMVPTQADYRAWFVDPTSSILGFGGSSTDIVRTYNYATNTNATFEVESRLTYQGAVPGYFDFPGTVGNFLSAPDAAALDIVGDITLIARIQPDTWTPTNAQSIIAKWRTGSLSYNFHMEPTGHLSLDTSPNGSTVVSTTSSATLARRPLGQWVWVAATMQVSNRGVRFWTSHNGSSWVELGTLSTGAATSIFNSTSPLDIGATDGGAQQNFAGNIARAEIRNGIGAGITVGGTVVFLYDSGPNLKNRLPTATSFTATTGQTVTLNKGAGYNVLVMNPTASAFRTEPLLYTIELNNADPPTTQKNFILNTPPILFPPSATNTEIIIDILTSNNGVYGATGTAAAATPIFIPYTQISVNGNSTWTTDAKKSITPSTPTLTFSTAYSIAIPEWSPFEASMIETITGVVDANGPWRENQRPPEANTSNVLTYFTDLTRNNFGIPNTENYIITWIGVDAVSSPDITVWIDSNTVKPAVTYGGETNVQIEYPTNAVVETLKTGLYRFSPFPLYVTLNPQVNEQWFPNVHSGYFYDDEQDYYLYANPTSITTSSNPHIISDINRQGAPILVSGINAGGTPYYDMRQVSNFIMDSNATLATPAYSLIHSEVKIGDGSTNLFAAYDDIYNITVKNLTLGEKSKYYLTPTIGTVSAPDPGPPSGDWCIAIRARLTSLDTATQPIVNQWTSTAGQRAWYLESQVSGLKFSTSSDGSTQTANVTLATLAQMQALGTGDVFIGASVSATRAAALTSADGVTWSEFGTPRIDTFDVFDSNFQVAIGGRQGQPAFLGNISSVEVRTGLDPASGTVLWRFDSSEYPGTGTVYTDPRGRTWTLTNDMAITPDFGDPATPNFGNVATPIVPYTSDNKIILSKPTIKGHEYEMSYRVRKSFYVEQINDNTQTKVVFDGPDYPSYGIVYETSQFNPATPIGIPLNTLYTSVDEGFIYIDHDTRPLRKLDITFSPSRILADSIDYGLLTVRTLDDVGNPKPFIKVNLFTNFGTLNLDNVTTDANGFAYATLTSELWDDTITPSPATPALPVPTLANDYLGRVLGVVIGTSISTAADFNIKVPPQPLYELIAAPISESMLADGESALSVVGRVRDSDMVPQRNALVWWRKGRYVYNVLTGTAPAFTNSSYVQYPGPSTSGTSISTPDANSLDVLGDITIVARIKPEVNALLGVIVAKNNSGSATLSYSFRAIAGGLGLGFSWNDGANTFNVTTAAGVLTTDLQWVAVTMDVNNGASGSTIRFWNSKDGITWTQIGVDIVQAVTVIVNSTSQLTIGSDLLGTANFYKGGISHVSIRNGINAVDGSPGGTEVFRFHASNIRGTAVNMTNGAQFRSSSNHLMTINNPAPASMQYISPTYAATPGKSLVSGYVTTDAQGRFVIDPFVSAKEPGYWFVSMESSGYMDASRPMPPSDAATPISATPWTFATPNAFRPIGDIVAWYEYPNVNAASDPITNIATGNNQDSTPFWELPNHTYGSKFPVTYDESSRIGTKSAATPQWIPPVWYAIDRYRQYQMGLLGSSYYKVGATPNNADYRNH